MLIANPDNVRLVGTGLDHPESVVLGDDGTIHAGGEKGQIYRIAPGGEPEEYANTGGDVLGCVLDAAGSLYVCDCHHRAVLRIAPDGAAATYTAGAPDRSFTFPNHLAFDAAGNLYVSDSGDRWDPEGTGTIHVVHPDGTTELFHRGPFRFANGVAVDPTGEWLYVAQSAAGDVVRIPLQRPDGPVEVTHELPAGTIPDGLVFTDDGTLLIACYKPDQVMAATPGGAATVLVDDPTAELILRPTNVAVSGGDLYIANLGGRWLTVVALGLPPEVRHRPELPARALDAGLVP